MEERVFSDPAVVEEINSRFIAVRVDITKPDHPDAHLLDDTFPADAIPVVALVDSTGKYVAEQTVGTQIDANKLTPEEYLAILQSVP